MLYQHYSRAALEFPGACSTAECKAGASVFKFLGSTFLVDVVDMLGADCLDEYDKNGNSLKCLYGGTKSGQNFWVGAASLVERTMKTLFLGGISDDIDSKVTLTAGDKALLNGNLLTDFAKMYKTVYTNPRGVSIALSNGNVTEFFRYAEKKLGALGMPGIFPTMDPVLATFASPAFPGMIADFIEHFQPCDPATPKLRRLAGNGTTGNTTGNTTGPPPPPPPPPPSTSPSPASSGSTSSSTAPSPSTQNVADMTGGAGAITCDLVKVRAREQHEINSAACRAQGWCPL